jgi:endogenous inhibitor of DNA gyrase (YacG/DUF329 family)
LDDLARWADGSYRVPGPPVDEQEPPEDEDTDDNDETD